MTETKTDSSSTIKAIETEYKGYRFRSRLEARWAVFFDSANIKWEYEKEGFISTAYEPPTRYLPDFYLPSTETWVEVKGGEGSLRDTDRLKLESILDWSSPIPHIRDSYGSGIGEKYYFYKTHGMIILGDIPEPRHGITLHPIIQHHEGLVWSWCMFDGSSIPVFSGRGLLTYLTHTENPEEWANDSLFISTPLALTKIVEAYRTARSARFEHGERG